MSAHDDDACTDAGATVEVDDVLIGHANAPRRDRLPDRFGLIRAVDAVERAAQIHGPGTERIVDAARHVARQVRAALQHLRRRAPIRPLALHGDGLCARPLEAGPADANCVLNGLPVSERVVEAPLGGGDHDRARPVAAAERHNLPPNRARLRTVLLLAIIAARLAAERVDFVAPPRIGESRGGAERSGAKKTDKGESDATHDGLELIVTGQAWRFQMNNAQLGCLIHPPVTVSTNRTEQFTRWVSSSEAHASHYLRRKPLTHSGSWPRLLSTFLASGMPSRAALR